MDGQSTGAPGANPPSSLKKLATLRGRGRKSPCSICLFCRQFTVSHQVDVLPAQWRQVGQRAVTGDTSLRLGTSSVLVRNSGST